MKLRIRFPSQSIRHFSHSSTRPINPFTRRLFKLPTPPHPPSLHHNDLPSFLSYTSRTALPSTSTTYIGTHYEYTVQSTLRSYAFTLSRIGGRSDAGIDLLGTWHLPSHSYPLRVIVQCKSVKSKVGPNLIRELEGTFRTSPVGWRTGQKVGILVSTREATKGVREAMGRSGYPLLWMMIERDGSVKQALWNAKVEELGLGDLGVETRYGGDGGRRIDLIWDGMDIPGMDVVEEEMASEEAKWVDEWGVSDEDKYEILEAVETLFPEQPVLTRLSGEDREKVLRFRDGLRRDRNENQS